MNKIGIDLGGTKIEGISLDDKFNVIERIRIPTQQEKGYNSIIASIVSLVNSLKKNSDYMFSSGGCAPGASSKKTGRQWS